MRRISVKNNLQQLRILSNYSETTKLNVTPRERPKTVEMIQDNVAKEVRITNDLLIEQKINVPKSQLLSFDEIPGPYVLRSIAKLWNILPSFVFQLHTRAIKYFLIAGKFYGSQLSWGRNFHILKWLFDNYGPIVRLSGPLGGDLVILTRPEHILSVFKNEGLYPIRSGLDSLETYHQETKRYKQSGMFSMYGKQWEKLRSSVQLEKASPQQIKRMVNVANNFVIRIRRLRNVQEEMPVNFHSEIFKWSVESVFLSLLNKELGMLTPIGVLVESEQQKMLINLVEATRALRQCESGFYLWKFMTTSSWNRLVKHCDVLDHLLRQYVHQTRIDLKTKKEQLEYVDNINNVSMLETLLLKDGVTTEDAVTILLDMLLIGVNAMTHTVVYLLYHLAKNPRVQKNLAYEVSATSSEDQTSEDLRSKLYLQAVIKENFRLKPPMPILSRILSSNISVHNYEIPKGTFMLMATHISNLREEYFEDAGKFNPDRWFTIENDVNGDMCNFACIPFGYGPRACMAQETVQLHLSVLIGKLLENFRIEYHYGDLTSSSQLFSEPNRPLKFKFVDVN